MIYAEADRLRFSVSHAPLIANIMVMAKMGMNVFLLVLKTLIPALFGKVIPMLTKKYHEN